MNFNIIDNLIIIHYFETGLSFIIDIYYTNENFFGPPFQIKKLYRPLKCLSNFFPDKNKNIDVLREEYVLDSLRSIKSIQERDLYSEKNIFLNKKFIFNKDYEFFMFLGIDFSKTDMRLEKEEIFNFFLRRNDGKFHAKEFIISCFIEKVELKILFKFFKKLIFNFYQNFNEQQMENKDKKQNIQKNILKNGEVVFYREEIEKLILNKFLKLLKKNPSKYEKYFCDFITLFQLFLYEEDIKDIFTKNFFEIFLKSNLKLRNYDFIYSLIQCHQIKWSFTLGFLLCEMGSKRKIFFELDLIEFKKYNKIFKLVDASYKKEYLQFGIDMIIRYRKYFKKKL